MRVMPARQGPKQRLKPHASTALRVVVRARLQRELAPGAEIASMAKSEHPQDKRVYDIRAVLSDDDRWLVLAISGDATLADLHLALLGAFEWPGRYSEVERRYSFEIGGQRFEDGRGSRTALRKLLSAGARFEYGCSPAAITLECSVAKQ